MSYIRIDTEAATYLFEAETVPEALDAFAHRADYRDYAELARTLGKTVEQAEADLTIAHVTAADIVRDIAAEAMASDAVEDGAEEPFTDVFNWADWCVEGSDGDAVRELAKTHGLEPAYLIDALHKALRDRDLADINAPFGAPSVERVNQIANDIFPAVMESVRGGSELDSWTGEEAIDAYAEGSEWEEEISIPALRAAVAARLDADLARQRAEE
ncbi:MULTISPECIES: hypothetical protein [unclassified Methylobacterium]|jgi:hypothetical protein|uniref:hypothetical protein n=1 Tax=unclassified Methylobacterium TaxID=2615210 RepID=UPI0005BDC94B|nr:MULTISPECIES: hypothetical protein [unclassified Methylobacterium]SFU94238.1 hypothetical protein SAMN02799643_03313 [Methylobacterium sp. UNCCL125]